MRVDRVTFASAIEQLAHFIGHGGSHQVVTVNAEFIMAAQKDRAFRAVLNNADLAIPDSIGVVWASRWLAQKHPDPKIRRLKSLPERVAGSDLLIALADRANQEGWRIYLLGAPPGVAQQAAQALKKHFPSLKIVGAESGPLIDAAGKPINDDQATLLETVFARIEHTKPDLLFAAFGAPKQDRFIARYRKRLKVPVMMGVGGAFDFLSGRAKRAPKLFQLLWLEWLWRLLLQPWRISRIFTAVVHFPIALLLRNK